MYIIIYHIYCIVMLTLLPQQTTNSLGRNKIKMFLINKSSCCSPFSRVFIIILYYWDDLTQHHHVCLADRVCRFQLYTVFFLAKSSVRYCCWSWWWWWWAIWSYADLSLVRASSALCDASLLVSLQYPPAPGWLLIINCWSKILDIVLCMSLWWIPLMRFFFLLLQLDDRFLRSYRLVS